MIRLTETEATAIADRIRPRPARPTGAPTNADVERAAEWLHNNVLRTRGGRPFATAAAAKKRHARRMAHLMLQAAGVL